MLGLFAEVTDLNLPRSPNYAISLDDTGDHMEGIVKLLQPFGHLTIIDDPAPLDFTKYPNFQLKALPFSWGKIYVYLPRSFVSGRKYRHIHPTSRQNIVTCSSSARINKSSRVGLPINTKKPWPNARYLVGNSSAVRIQMP